MNAEYALGSGKALFKLPFHVTWNDTGTRQNSTQFTSTNRNKKKGDGGPAWQRIHDIVDGIWMTL